MTIFYNRMSDINNLENIYLREKDSSRIKTNNFDEMYYNFRKKIDKSKKFVNLIKRKDISGSYGNKNTTSNVESKNFIENEKQKIKSIKLISTVKPLFEQSSNDLGNQSKKHIRDISIGNQALKAKYLADLFDDEYLQENQGEIDKFKDIKKSMFKM